MSLVRESASTTRVLDLPYIYDRYGDTIEYQNRPLFRSAQLNSCIVVKHALRVHERSLFNGARATATKIVFPFSKADLRLGGAGIFVGEPDYERALKSRLGEHQDGGFDADIDLLSLLDALPSFDPFLMRERLRQSGIEPARCYFDISEADASRMQKFVTSQIAALVELAFTGSEQAPRELSSRLAEKLMTDETAQSLQPLRATLRLTGEEYREGVFAWKGFLYYKWVFGEVSPKIGELARSILAARILNASRQEAIDYGALRQRIVRLLGLTMSRISASLMDYDEAFNSLSDGKPTAFRDFLLSAPRLFLVIGEAVGVVKHIDSFWRFRFPAGRTHTMDSKEAAEIFGDFELTLNSIEAAQNTVAA